MVSAPSLRAQEYTSTNLSNHHQKISHLNSISPAKTFSVNSSLTNSPNVPSRKGNFTIKHRWDDSPLPEVALPDAHRGEGALDVEAQLKAKKLCPW